MSLRKKIADSEAVLNWAARRIAGYIRMVHRNTRWQRIGYEELDALAEQGEPVIVVLWHQRLAQSPYFFPLDKAPICSITSAARGGQHGRACTAAFRHGYDCHVEPQTACRLVTRSSGQDETGNLDRYCS